MATYQVRTFESILSDLITSFVGNNGTITDFNEGSVIRTIIEAFALEAARLYIAQQVGINQAQEQSSYTTFGFTPLTAQQAYGRVLFTMDPAATSVTVPRGTVVSTSGSTALLYETTQDLLLTTNVPSSTVTVLATNPGSVYNVSANAINTLVSSVPSVTTVTNPRSLVTGTDDETDAQRRDRFAQFIQGLHRATKTAILFGAKQTVITDSDGYVIERVISANTIEVSPGNIAVYVYNGTGNTSVDLVNQAGLVIAGYKDAKGIHEGWKAAGITCSVLPATETPVDVVVVVDVLDGFLPESVTLSVQSAIYDFFGTLDVGEILRLEPLKQSVLAQPGVLDIAEFSSPTSNLVPSADVVYVPGSIVVTSTDTLGNSSIDVVIGE